MFVCAPVCVSLCVFCFADDDQIKAAEHYNWLLQHHFSDMRLATERKIQRHRSECQ